MLSFRTVFLLLFFVACNSSTPTEPDSWRIELVTTGGITGMGNGNLTVDSSGALVTTSLSGRQCTSTATADELRVLGAALAGAGSWASSYLPPQTCCDRIESQLTVRRAGTTRTVKWIDDPLPMPADLVALAAELGRVKAAHPCA